MGKHFVFVTDPSFGHINPVLPVVEELVRRGHRVSYGTSDAFVPTVEKVGAKAIPLPWREPPRPTNPEVTADDMADMQEHVLADTITSMPILDAYCARDAPDGVCFDFVSFPGRILANKGPWAKVALFPTFAGNEHFSLTAIYVSDTFEYNNPRLGDLDARMRAYAGQHGVTLNPNPLAEILAPLNIVFIPKEFHIAGDTFDERFRFVGPSLRSWEDPDNWQPAPGDGPLVLVSLGTGFNARPEFFRRCVEAFAGTDWRVVIALGDKVQVADLGELPSNVDARPFVPQQAVLRHADVFVCHLGMGSTMDGLYFGTPLVGVPQMPESWVVGARIEELGIGRVLKLDELTPELLAETVMQVAKDESIKTKMAAMRRLTRQAGGAVAAAAAIQALRAEGDKA